MKEKGSIVHVPQYIATLLVEDELYPAMAVGMEASKLAIENKVMDEYIMNECVFS